MGDVVSLVERAEEAIAEDEQAHLEAQMRKGQFTFDDFLSAQKMLRRMGPLQGVLKMIPGMNQIPTADVDESQLKRVEAIVLSMTPHERAVPHAIDGHRRERIARGSGSTVPEVNQLLEARKMMEKMMKQLSSGKMPSLPGMPPMPGAPAQTRHPGSKKAKAKRKSKRR
jgi:signal recognition particle subunit SRP54